VIDGEAGIRLLVSLVYWVLRRLLELVVLRLRSEHSKELEILVLRQQLQVLQRQVGRPRLQMADRVMLAAFSRSLPRPAWSSLFVSPATLLRWHRELVALGIRVAPSTVWAILRRHRVEPTPRRAELSWSQFLPAPASAIVACDFLTVDTVSLRRLYVLFFIELGSRRVRQIQLRLRPGVP
jgi:hypothetical protein